MHTDLIIDLLDKQGSEITEQWIEHTPMRRMGRPSELQGAVVWMASEASSFMTGSNIVSLLLPWIGIGVKLTWVGDRLWMGVIAVIEFRLHLDSWWHMSFGICSVTFAKTYRLNTEYQKHVTMYKAT
jgi:hypothetical protein